MLEAAEKIQKYTAHLNFETFLKSEMTIDAVARNFEIIGEAANRIDSDFKSQNQQIGWLRITGFRNRIIHDYFGIDYEIMWHIIEDNLTDLIRKLQQMIDQAEKD